MTFLQRNDKEGRAALKRRRGESTAQLNPFPSRADAVSISISLGHFMLHDWQFWTAAIQTAALVAAVIVALRVGLEQAAISREQARISAELLNFQYAFSVQVSYDQVRHLFYFWNTGYSNIYLEQEIFPEGHTHTEPQRQIIPAGHWW